MTYSCLDEFSPDNATLPPESCRATQLYYNLMLTGRHQEVEEAERRKDDRDSDGWRHQKDFPVVPAVNEKNSEENSDDSGDGDADGSPQSLGIRVEPVVKVALGLATETKTLVLVKPLG